MRIKLINSSVYLRNCGKKTEGGFYTVEHCMSKKPIDFQIANTGQYLAFVEMTLLEELGRDDKNRLVLKPRVENKPYLYQLKLVDRDVFLMMSDSLCLTYRNQMFTFETCNYLDNQKFQFRRLGKVKVKKGGEDQEEWEDTATEEVPEIMEEPVKYQKDPNFVPPALENKAYEDNFNELNF